MKRTPMRRQSAKRAALIRVYLKRRGPFLEAHPWCLRCGGVATEVHHKAGRIGDLLLDESKWAAMCSDCHGYAGSHPLEAIARGWSLPRVGRAPAYACPTSCDSDCDTLCHEGHQVTWKQEHDVHECEERAFDALFAAGIPVEVTDRPTNG